MTPANYDASRGTPLYDQSLVLLGTVITKSQELAEAGVAVRTVTLIITDGADEHSTRATASTVAALVADMQKSERHIVAAMGIDGGHTDFRRVFREMGIADRWILTPRSHPGEVRRAFVVFSQSALALGQGAASFSRASLGGFSN
jgi:hypothetical protein